MKYSSIAPSEVAVDATTKRFSLTSFPPFQKAATASRLHIATSRQGALAPAQAPAVTAPSVEHQHGYRLRARKEDWVSDSALARALSPRSAAMRKLQATLFDSRSARVAWTLHGLDSPTPAMEKLRQLSAPSTPIESDVDSLFSKSSTVPSPASTPSSLGYRFFARALRPTVTRGIPYVRVYRSEEDVG